MTDPIVVQLDWCDVVTLASVGVMRHVRALRRGLRPAYGADKRDCWGLHIEGAAGEYAVAKALRRFWPGVGEVKAEDVDGVQVRTTSHHTGRLLIYPTDPDLVPFVFAVGRIPRFDVVGWLYGYEGKRAEWLSDLNGTSPELVYAVPQSALLPLDTLPAVMGAYDVRATDD